MNIYFDNEDTRLAVLRWLDSGDKADERWARQMLRASRLLPRKDQTDIGQWREELRDSLNSVEGATAENKMTEAISRAKKRVVTKMKIELISDFEMIVARNDQWLKKREQAAKTEEMFSFSQAEHDRNLLIERLRKIYLTNARIEEAIDWIENEA